MPEWQLDQVLRTEYGSDWATKFHRFEKVPFAAASIGQVHRATVCEGQNTELKDIVVKVQYPGIEESIQSDIANLRMILNFSGLLPKGLFLDNSLRVMKKELAWETDYKREAYYTKWFGRQNLVEQEHSKRFGVYALKVPLVYESLSTEKILATEYLEGIPINEAVNFPQAVRDRIGTSVMYLCLKELFVFRVMQTDPNWTNFLFNPKTKEINLLDFGSTREFDGKFVNLYKDLVLAAAEEDRELCEKLSVKLGFLTGDESSTMKNLHIDSMLILGLPFRSGVASSSRYYNFADHLEITRAVRANIPKMLDERLCPPPDDSYSLHRKLSGAYLLCAKLQSRIPCRQLLELFKNYPVYNNLRQ